MATRLKIAMNADEIARISVPKGTCITLNISPIMKTEATKPLIVSSRAKELLFVIVVKILIIVCYYLVTIVVDGELARE